MNGLFGSVAMVRGGRVGGKAGGKVGGKADGKVGDKVDGKVGGNTRHAPPFRPGPGRSIWAAAIASICGVCLVACHGSKNPTPTVVAVDACSLLSDADVHALAPKLGAGHKSKVIVANTSRCEWDDARHLPALTVLVGPADPSGLKKGLEDGFAAMGYDVRDVTGLGDEAVVAVQQADPAHGLEAVVAELALRVGKRQVILSPTYLKIRMTPGGGFKQLKGLAAQAAAHLRARDGGTAP